MCKCQLGTLAKSQLLHVMCLHVQGSKPRCAGVTFKVGVSSLCVKKDFQSCDTFVKVIFVRKAVHQTSDKEVI